MKALRWCLINGTFLALAIAGFGYGVTGAAACAAFLIWFYFLVWALIAFGRAMGAPKTKEFEVGVPRWLDVTYDILILGITVWTGHWFLGILWTFCVIAQNQYIEAPCDTK